MRELDTDAFREHLVNSLKGGQAFVSYKKALDGIRPECRGARTSPAVGRTSPHLRHAFFFIKCVS